MGSSDWFLLGVYCGVLLLFVVEIIGLHWGLHYS